MEDVSQVMLNNIHHLPIFLYKNKTYDSNFQSILFNPFTVVPVGAGDIYLFPFSIRNNTYLAASPIKRAVHNSRTITK